MREAGLTVHGSDGCALAVEYARLLAGEEGYSDIPYYVSSWADLPRRTDTRYAAIFNDALSWIYSEKEMASSLKGLFDCLRPGGILAYMGALPDTETDQAVLLDEEWGKRMANGRHWLGFRAAEGKTSVQEVVFLEKGPDFIDEYHLYIVDANGTRRLDEWCLRCPVKWSWQKIQPFLSQAGFASFGTKEFIAANGRPFNLVLAERP